MTLTVEHLTCQFGEHTVLNDLNLTVPQGSFTAIIGPNGCGKSTLLRALARAIPAQSGRVLLNGTPLAQLHTRAVAREVGLLPQTSTAPDGIRVADLVARGRAPHQSFFRQWSRTDEQAVTEALAATQLTQLSHRLVSELSGGQRQRVWVAMLLAQETPVMLLDEPTTYLDIAHQYDLMELFRTLHEAGKTIIAVLHDLTQAARYADHLIVLKDGQVVTTGAPAEVLTAPLVAEAFGLQAHVLPDPVTGTPAVFPLDPRTAERLPAGQSTIGR